MSRAPLDRYDTPAALAARIVAELPYQLLYRRQVLRALDVTGRGNRDTLVRERLAEMHGGSVKAAKGRKASPGPLYGIAGHAWQALAVAIAADLVREE